ncbi:MAG: outer membrane lipoprotein carrier protein LolA [Rhodospirillales bacterium]|nr:outer membrane lipoprotein carrier protein LolA [Rhodospirillales bacterium]
MSAPPVCIGVAPRQIGAMHRRTLLLLPLAAALAAAAPTAAPLTAEDRADLGRVQAYLNGIHTLKAHFLQVAPNGATSEGTAWMQRPGRMRFQYDPPSPLLLVAGHGLAVYYDRELRQISNVPLGSTPLGLLLQPEITLSGDVTVTGFARAPGQLQVTLLRTASPGDGSLTLVFADNPLALRQWRLTDAQRQETTVTLYNVELGGSFDQDMFTLVNPREFPDQDKYYH